MALDLTNFFTQLNALGTLNEQRVAQAMRQQAAEDQARRDHALAMERFEGQARLQAQLQQEAEDRALRQRALVVGLDVAPGEKVDLELLSQRERDYQLDLEGEKNALALSHAVNVAQAQQKVANQAAAAYLQNNPGDLDRLTQPQALRQVLGPVTALENVPQDPSEYVGGDAEYDPRLFLPDAARERTDQLNQEIFNDPARLASAAQQVQALRASERETNAEVAKQTRKDLAAAKLDFAKAAGDAGLSAEELSTYVVGDTPEAYAYAAASIAYTKEKGAATTKANFILRSFASVDAQYAALEAALIKANAGDEIGAGDSSEILEEMGKLATKRADMFMEVSKKDADILDAIGGVELQQRKTEIQAALADPHTPFAHRAPLRAELEKLERQEAVGEGEEPPPPPPEPTPLSLQQQAAAQALGPEEGAFANFITTDFMEGDVGDDLDKLESFANALANTPDPSAALKVVNSSLKALQDRKALADAYLKAYPNSGRGTQAARDAMHIPLWERGDLVERKGHGSLDRNYLDTVPILSPDLRARIGALNQVKYALMNALGPINAGTLTPTPTPTPVRDIIEQSPFLPLPDARK